MKTLTMTKNSKVSLYLQQENVKQNDDLNTFI